MLISNEDVVAVAAPPVRLADLAASLYERRSSPENLRAGVARRIAFLRAARTRVVERLHAFVTRRERVRDEVRVMAQVLRVRAALEPDERRSFDQLVVDYPQSTLGLLIDRDDGEALAAVRRYLASVTTTMPPST